jgi:hypothetical protein
MESLLTVQEPTRDGMLWAVLAAVAGEPELEVGIKIVLAVVLSFPLAVLFL